MKKPLPILIVLLLGFSFLQAQSQNYVVGETYIGEAGFVYISTGNLVHIEGNITTVRNITTAQRGMLAFAESADWISSNSSFVNGYVRSHRSDAFVFPVGQGVYRPAAISNATNAAPTDAAYYNTAQYSETNLADKLLAISNESWIIQGTVATTITLSWTTDISAFADNMNDLCVAGWKSSISKWVEVPSEVDLISPIFGIASELDTKGTISTTSPVVPNSYAAYTLGRKCHAPPTLLFDTLAAYQYMPIDLILAVDTIPGMTYIFYTNLDKTGPLSSSVVTYTPPKDDYYVTANNEKCESDPSRIILKDPCPEYLEDAEGHPYKVVSLMGRCWTENLQTTLNPVTNEQILFANPYTCTECAAQLDTIFGLLYTWQAAVGISLTTPIQGICPNGWHIPSQAEWRLLERYSAQLMSMNYWLDPPGGGTDDFDFTALPAGWYNGAIERYQDLYGFAGWWASDAPTETTANYFSMNYYCDTLQQSEMKKSNGLSVRCVMN